MLKLNGHHVCAAVSKGADQPVTEGEGADGGAWLVLPRKLIDQGAGHLMLQLNHGSMICRPMAQIQRFQGQFFQCDYLITHIHSPLRIPSLQKLKAYEHGITDTVAHFVQKDNVPSIEISLWGKIVFVHKVTGAAKHSQVACIGVNRQIE